MVQPFTQRLGRRVRRFAEGLMLVPTVLTVACSRCPNRRYGDLLATIPSQQDKVAGQDLAGWQFRTVISEATGYGHHYFWYPSPCPDAPTMVLVHGMFLDGRTFAHFTPLAERFNLVAYDLPYDSPLYRGQRSDFVELLTDFLRAMHISTLYLGGVSLGGQIAMTFMAEARGFEVRALILISTDISKTKRELHRERRIGQVSAMLTGLEDERMVCLVHRLSERQRRKAEESDAGVFDIFAIKPPSFYRQVLQSLSNGRGLVDLGAITCPTLIIHGDQDETISIDKARGLLPRIPQAQFVTIAGGGHDIAFAQGEDLARRILEFLGPS